MSILSAISGAYRGFRRGLQEKPARAGLAASKNSAATEGKWKFADKFPQDISINAADRATVVSRSRDEFNNNPAYQGHHRLKSGLVIRRGPNLQVNIRGDKTRLDNAIEQAFYDWWEEAEMIEKFKTLFVSYMRDGEAVGILVHNPKLTTVPLDLQLIDPYRLTDGRSLDGGGIIFDAYGNPEYYNILPYHPGVKTSKPNKVPAAYVIHLREILFPEQTRGIPQGSSSLITYAGEDRYTNSAIKTAEINACLSGVITTDSTDPESDMGGTAGARLQTFPGSYQVLPAGTDFKSVSASQPTAEYTQFTSTVISRCAMPFGLPRQLAGLDSSAYSFAGAMMDQITSNELFDSDRELIERRVLKRLFFAWYEEARLIYPELNTDKKITLTWNWRGNLHVDPVKNANADGINLKNMTTTFSKVQASKGDDWRDTLDQLEIEVQEFKKRGLKHPMAADDKPEQVHTQEEIQDEPDSK